jgi:hypothetical protein
MNKILGFKLHFISFLSIPPFPPKSTTCHLRKRKGDVFYILFLFLTMQLNYCLRNKTAKTKQQNNKKHSKNKNKNKITKLEEGREEREIARGKKK